MLDSMDQEHRGGKYGEHDSKGWQGKLAASAFCLAPQSLEERLVERNHHHHIDEPIEVEPKQSGETFIEARNGALSSATVGDYWQWAYSDLVDNTSRGFLAEFIVAMALGSKEAVREIGPHMTWRLPRESRWRLSVLPSFNPGGRKLFRHLLLELPRLNVGTGPPEVMLVNQSDLRMSSYFACSPSRGTNAF